MANLEFSTNLSGPHDKLMKLATSFEDYPKYLPSAIKSVRVIEKKDSETTTEEIFTFTTLFDHELIQRSKHTVIGQNKIHSEVIFGPFKGTVIDVTFEKTDSGTRVNVKAVTKIPLKYKILEPIIKKQYKIITLGFLYKMNAQLI